MKGIPEWAYSHSGNPTPTPRQHLCPGTPKTASKEWANIEGRQAADLGGKRRCQLEAAEE